MILISLEDYLSLIGTLSMRDETSLLEKENSLASCRVTSSINSAAIVTLRVAFFGRGFIRSGTRRESGHSCDYLWQYVMDGKWAMATMIRRGNNHTLREGGVLPSRRGRNEFISKFLSIKKSPLHRL